MAQGKGRSLSRPAKLMPTTSPPQTVSLVSLGCAKNLVDSEGLVSTLISRGFRVVSDPERSDLVIVNTCGFLGAAREESLGAIREMVALKSCGVKGVMVTGCMVGNYRELLDREAPGVDRLVGFHEYDRIDDLAREILPDCGRSGFREEREWMDAALTPAHYAWLKISEGCNHSCSFCVIPSIRGEMVSRPINDLVARAKTLGERGVREINLIAQDSTSYGADLYGQVRLPALLRKLDAVEGISWIRLMYAYPTEVREELAETLASGKRILPYLDVPIQHVSTPLLKRMRRGYGRADLDTMIHRLRSAAPQIALRTTVIVGFPGESEAEFCELLEFIAEARFDRLGAFRYSHEEGSRAEAMASERLPQEVIEERWHRLMAAQQDVSFSKNQDRVGKRERVLVDFAKDEDQPARARGICDAPEVDANVLLDDASLAAGDLLEVEIVAARGYDVEAVISRAPESHASI